MLGKQSLFRAVALVLGIGSFAVGETRLAHVFQNNMVLQRSVPVPVWGWADPGTTVEVAFAHHHARAKADVDGHWQAMLDPLIECRAGRSLEVRNGDTVLIRRNVVVGEVWLAAGQSNMNHSGPDLPTGLYPHPVSTMEPGKPDVRITRYGEGASLVPLDDVDSADRSDSPWTILPGDKAITTLNIPTAFARFLRDRLNVPIGIVHVAVSGTNQGAWMHRKTLESFPGHQEYANYFEELLATHNADLARKGTAIRSWEEFERAMVAWRVNRQGRSPANMTIMNFPTTLYNTRIHPLAPFALRGVIWHQGEAGPGGPYGRRLVAMAQQWRECFGQDFYFIWGTLTRDTTASSPLEPQPTWFYRSATNREIREARTYFGNDGKAALVELYDVGDHETHFLQKAEASRRFGLAALTLAYGEDHLFSGPLKASVRMDGSKATVRFDRVGEGLLYAPSIDGISGVYIKGKEGAYRWAKVEVVGKDTIVVSHPDVREIEAVGYGVNDNPHETLFNSDEFPASPFKVNMGRLPWSGHASGTKMVTLDGSESSKRSVSITHVRQNGFVFQLVGGRGKPPGVPAVVHVYIPNHWSDFVVTSEEARIEVQTRESEGKRFATFAAPADGTWIVVAEEDHVDELKHMHRF